MTMAGCYTPILACRLRVALLDDAGAPDAGATSMVVTDSLVRIGYSLVISEGTAFEKKNGCGNVCVQYQGNDKVKAVNLTMEVCTLDYELVELMTQATLVSEGGFSRGTAIPDVNTELTRRVSVEAWSPLWDGDEQATRGASLLHLRYIFPSTTWVEGDRTAEEGITVLQFTGRGRGNANFGDGPGNDLPWGVYTSPKGEYEDDGALPDANCGYTTLVAS